MAAKYCMHVMSGCGPAIGMMQYITSKNKDTLHRCRDSARCCSLGLIPATKPCLRGSVALL